MEVTAGSYNNFPENVFDNIISIMPRYLIFLIFTSIFLLLYLYTVIIHVIPYYCNIILNVLVVFFVYFTHFFNLYI